MIIRYRQAHGLKQKELSSKLGVDEARMSEILHYKIENFTLDRLVGYAQALYPNLKLNLVAA
ncbi:MAG: XRE family transcriptional regulator [Deltaproteobacteria bacterium]|nr:XRE family transcriptional regulator [Deltaproteobacteria bacterium]